MYRTFTGFFLMALSCVFVNAQPHKYHFTQSKMGSAFNIVLMAEDSAFAAKIAERSFALVDSFNHIFSDYDMTSELSLINQQAGAGPQLLSPALYDIIRQSANAWKQSKGAFDISVGALTQLWRKARKEKILPDKKNIDAQRKRVGFDRIILKDHFITLQPGMMIDLGGIGKGYVAQKVIDFLKQHGITQALADAGGDMAMSDAPGETNGWIVGINIPETTDDLLPRKLQLKNIAVASSGDAYQYIEHNGLKYSHIIDPRTGYGIHSQRNVTVIANEGALADWLTKVGSILPIEQAKQIAVSLHAEMLITTLDHGKIVYHSTKRFSQYWKR